MQGSQYGNVSVSPTPLSRENAALISLHMRTQDWNSNLYLQCGKTINLEIKFRKDC